MPRALVAGECLKLPVLMGLEGLDVRTDALFDVLRLEVLDWRLDHGVDARTLTLAADADDIAAASMIPAPPEEASS